MDHRAKLDWAHQHLIALDSEIKAFVNDGEAHAMTLKFDEVRQKYVAILHVTKPLPGDWSLKIGDILHNTRSALDSLTYALAVKNLRRAPTLKEVKRIQFVIVDAPEDWDGACKSNLSCLSPLARKAIEAVQPYHRTDVKFRHFLSVMRDLSNVDKHRHVIVVGEAANTAGVTIEGPDIDPRSTIAGWHGPLVDGAEIATWDFRHSDGSTVPKELHPKMHVQGHVSVDITFSRSHATPVGGSVTGFLFGLCQNVRDNIFPPIEAILSEP